jgi:hypothetical protein
MRPLTFFLLTAIILLSACATTSSLVATPPSLALSTAEGLSAVSTALSPTATIIWFPATATDTPFPTIQASATPQLFPGLGQQVFSDDFSDPKNWPNAKPESSGGNSIILERNRLTLALNIPPATFYSLQNGLLLRDFYAEMTVSVNRCSGEDTYGMVFRAASEAYAYRFALNCNGQARVDRIRSDIVSPLQDWLPSGDAPPGAPGEVRMGIWAAGAEMRFFLNGRYQFTVIDPVFKSGTLGVFANASSADGMNVNFSKLTVNSVDYVSPTPTATASKTPKPSRTPRPTP